MKKFLLAFALLVLTTMSYAQSTLVATLTHTDTGTVSIFTNNTALQQALKAAKDGDIISLSTGQFFAGEITKNITLRGVGMNENKSSDNSHGSTVVTQTLKINIPSDAKGKLRFEGVYFRDSLQYFSDLKNATFEKCRFYTFRYRSPSETQSGKLSDCTFLHCRVANSITISKDSHVSFHNSVVCNPFNAEQLNSNFEFLNCYVRLFTWWTVGNNKYYYGQAVENSVYRNCLIVCNTSDHGSLSKTCTVSYCVGYSTGNTASVFNFIDAVSNSTNKNCSPVVFRPSLRIDDGYSDTNQYVLTDEAKAKYLGSDGTEVGIHGGALPYSEDPIRPKILNVLVGKRTTSTGYLPVQIQAQDAKY